MAVFPSAAAAIDCAVSMNQLIEVRNRTADDRFDIRVGVSVGDATYDEGDYFGPAVIEAARLCARAQPGQVLLTDVTRVMVGSRGGHRFASVGELALKGLPEPVPAHELSWEPLPPTARPSPDIERDGELPPLPLGPERPMPAVVENTFAGLSTELHGPVFSERFVGRESELVALDAESGVVLIAGEAGVGKSGWSARSSAGRLPREGSCWSASASS